jgi:hypothetical protein
MISIIVVVAILVNHFVADFVLQSDWMAKNKSFNDNALVLHVFIYTFALMPLYFVFKYNGDNTMIFAGFIIANFYLHVATDYVTSRLNTYLWKKGQVHYFFVSVGFDQLLHYAALFSTYWFFIRIIQ